MEDNILKILLASGVIANLVTSIFNLTQGFHKDKIDNVIKERKSWREKIRSIAAKIQGSCKCDIKNVLSELKVRLNAYGIESESDYKKDTHIWGIVRKMENTDYNQKEYSEDFEVDKKFLVEYLSLLLKYDWERSKNEVFGNIKIYAFDVVFWIGFVVLLFIFSFDEWIIQSIFLVVCLIFMFAVKLIGEKKIKELDSRLLIVVIILLIVVIIILLFENKIQILENIFTDKVFIKTFIIYVVMIGIFLWIRIKEKKKQSENEENYELKVKDITNQEVVLGCIIGNLKKLKENNDSEEVECALKYLEQLSKEIKKDNEN